MALHNLKILNEFGLARLFVRKTNTSYKRTSLINYREFIRPPAVVGGPAVYLHPSWTHQVHWVGWSIYGKYLNGVSCGHQVGPENTTININRVP